MYQLFWHLEPRVVYLDNTASTPPFKIINFRGYIHRPCGVSGVSQEEATKAIDEILPPCVQPSSDAKNIRTVAILRRSQ